MAAPFVPVPLAADWTGYRRSWTRTGSPVHPVSFINCEPSPSESISRAIEVGPWIVVFGALTANYFWSRPRGGVLDGSSALVEAEGKPRDRWVERPISLTLLDYEILEERAKFTVYKVLVTGCHGDSWVIFRRYSDFCRLNDKLKDLFPGSGSVLPPKRWLKNNYDKEFLEQRQIGLQTFLQNVMSHKAIMSSEAIRHFLCLAEPPSPLYSLEESRAFCETLEETNHRLQRELLENQREVDTLKKILEEKENHLSLLVKKIKALSHSSESFVVSCKLTASKATDSIESH